MHAFSSPRAPLSDQQQGGDPLTARVWARHAAIVVALVWFAAACGSNVVELTEVTPAEPLDRPTIAAVEPTAVPPVEPTPEPTSERSIQDVIGATVKIRTEGRFVPPLELDEISFAGNGTGFIIDSSGIMVTNNHVVTGSSTIEAFFDDTEEPIRAELLGVSECSDLAVLDLEGDGYEFLEFRSSMDDVSPGLPIFAAGYPQNLDTDFFALDYTLTAGIVSTTRAGGNTSWASVDGVIEHDARIRVGNSGGPLVDEQGRVVGINYAGENTNDLNSAIDAVAAAAIIEGLKNGDVESLGINGQAIVLEDGSGVWVAAVAPQSPADLAGLQPGDLIVEMEGQELATDGTMSTYCDIIRANDPQATLSIEVVRLGSEEVLTGEINGAPLNQEFSFATELADEMADSGSDIVAGYTDYDFVQDATGSVGVAVPAEWVDRNGEFNADFGESIYASPDIEAFTGTWDVPGVIVERSTDLTSADIDAVLDLWTDFDCADRSGREDFATSDGTFTGKWEVFTACGGTESAVLAIAVSPPDDGQVVRMFFQIVSDADLEAADRAIESFDAAQ